MAKTRQQLTDPTWQDIGSFFGEFYENFVAGNLTDFGDWRKSWLRNRNLTAQRLAERFYLIIAVFISIGFAGMSWTLLLGPSAPIPILFWGLYGVGVVLFGGLWAYGLKQGFGIIKKPANRGRTPINQEGPLSQGVYRIGIGATILFTIVMFGGMALDYNIGNIVKQRDATALAPYELALEQANSSKIQSDIEKAKAALAAQQRAIALVHEDTRNREEFASYWPLIFVFLGGLPLFPFLALGQAGSILATLVFSTKDACVDALTEPIRLLKSKIGIELSDEAKKELATKARDAQEKFEELTRANIGIVRLLFTALSVIGLILHLNPAPSGWLFAIGAIMGVAIILMIRQSFLIIGFDIPKYLYAGSIVLYIGLLGGRAMLFYIRWMMGLYETGGVRFFVALIVSGGVLWLFYRMVNTVRLKEEEWRVRHGLAETLIVKLLPNKFDAEGKATAYIPIPKNRKYRKLIPELSPLEEKSPSAGSSEGSTTSGGNRPTSGLVWVFAAAVLLTAVIWLFSGKTSDAETIQSGAAYVPHLGQQVRDFRVTPFLPGLLGAAVVLTFLWSVVSRKWVVAFLAIIAGVVLAPWVESHAGPGIAVSSSVAGSPVGRAPALSLASIVGNNGGGGEHCDPNLVRIPSDDINGDGVPDSMVYPVTVKEAYPRAAQFALSARPSWNIEAFGCVNSTSDKNDGAYGWVGPAGWRDQEKTGTAGFMATLVWSKGAESELLQWFAYRGHVLSIPCAQGCEVWAAVNDNTTGGMAKEFKDNVGLMILRVSPGP